MAFVLVVNGSDTGRVAPTRIEGVRSLFCSAGLGRCPTSRDADEAKGHVALGVEHLGDEVERLLNHLDRSHLATLESSRHIANCLEELCLHRSEEQTSELQSP